MRNILIWYLFNLRCTSIEEPALPEQYYTLNNWLNNICARIEISNLSASNKKYIMKKYKY